MKDIELLQIKLSNPDLLEVGELRADLKEIISRFCDYTIDQQLDFASFVQSLTYDNSSLYYDIIITLQEHFKEKN